MLGRRAPVEGTGEGEPFSPVKLDSIAHDSRRAVSGLERRDALARALCGEKASGQTLFVFPLIEPPVVPVQPTLLQLQQRCIIERSGHFGRTQSLLYCKMLLLR